MTLPPSRIRQENASAKGIQERKPRGKNTLHRRKLPIKQTRWGTKQDRWHLRDQKWNTLTSKTLIRVSTKRKSRSHERTTVAPVAASQVISGKIVYDPFKYRQSADERSTTATQEDFVPGSNSEYHRSLPWLIEAGKEIHIK